MGGGRLSSYSYIASDSPTIHELQGNHVDAAGPAYIQTMVCFLDSRSQVAGPKACLSFGGISLTGSAPQEG